MAPLVPVATARAFALRVPMQLFVVRWETAWERQRVCVGNKHVRQQGADKIDHRTSIPRTIARHMNEEALSVQTGKTYGGEVLSGGEENRVQPWLLRLRGLRIGWGCRFDPRSRHMPGLWARPLVGGV